MDWVPYGALINEFLNARVLFKSTISPETNRLRCSLLFYRSVIISSKLFKHHLPPFRRYDLRGTKLAQPQYRRIFADVIVYIFAHQHTTYLIEAVAVYMS